MAEKEAFYIENFIKKEQSPFHRSKTQFFDKK
jgi:hypothetical protein